LHVSPRLHHTLGVSFPLANWAEPKNAGSSPLETGSIDENGDKKEGNGTFYIRQAKTREAPSVFALAFGVASSRLPP
jgi:hypothetical protein